LEFSPSFIYYPDIVGGVAPRLAKRLSSHPVAVRQTKDHIFIGPFDRSPTITSTRMATHHQQQQQNRQALRIPPPPLLPEEQRARSEAQYPGSRRPWVLSVRCQSRTGGVACVRIQVYPIMTDETLGRCIVQAVSSYNSMAPTEQIVVRSLHCTAISP
jgi:hypothetical protein